MSPLTITELVGIAIGCMLVALGLTSMSALALRRGASRRLPLVFGLFAVLYGTRLLAQQPAVRLTLGGSPVAWGYLVAVTTYVINVPCGLFVESLVGPGWKQSIRITWVLQATYAVVAIAIDLALQRPGAAMRPNVPIVLAGIGVAGLNLWWYRRRLSRTFATPALAAGGILLALFVLNHNLGQPIAPSIDLEPVGVLVFVATLGYAVIATVLRGEAELAAVQRELDTARQIQSSLLPREAPRIPGVEVAMRYIPMTAVAGDFYDFVALGASRLGVLVADVSGHGVPAALVASMVKLAFSTFAGDAHDPARLLAAMNRVLARQLTSGFVTAVYAVIDLERWTLTTANAGHPPLFIGRADRAVTAAGEHGIVLGFVPEAAYTNTEVPLRSGDLILFYTDGVTEAANPAGEFFDPDRVKGWLQAGDVREPGAFVAAALDALSAWRGPHAGFDDDVTLLAARVSAAADLRA
jgi:sigma-B regulation protein RsbU (phosphoserine phosphatase)